MTTDSVCLAGRDKEDVFRKEERCLLFGCKDTHRGILSDEKVFTEIPVPDNCVEMLSTLVHEFCKRVDSGKS